MIPEGRKIQKKILDKKKLSKRLDALESGFSELRKKQNKMAFVYAQNQSLLQEQNQAAYETLMGLVHYAFDKLGLTEEVLTEYRDQFVKSLLVEKFEEAKKDLNPGQAVCEDCVLVASIIRFTKSEEDQKDMTKTRFICPRCSGENIYCSPFKVESEQ